MVYIQTKGADVARRLYQLAALQGGSEGGGGAATAALQRIEVLAVCDLDELMSVLAAEADAAAAIGGGALSLLVVDCISELAALDQGYDAAFGRVAHTSGLLRSIAVGAGACVLLTNTTVQGGGGRGGGGGGLPNAELTIAGFPEPVEVAALRPALGHSWLHFGGVAVRVGVWLVHDRRPGQAGARMLHLAVLHSAAGAVQTVGTQCTVLLAD